MTAAQLALAVYIAAVNLLAFALYAVDKRRARLSATLHHKTKHNKFYFTVSTAFFVQVFLYAYLCWRFS